MLVTLPGDGIAINNARHCLLRYYRSKEILQESPCLHIAYTHICLQNFAVPFI